MFGERLHKYQDLVRGYDECGTIGVLLCTTTIKRSFATVSMKYCKKRLFDFLRTYL